MKILIIGASGTIGKAIVETLSPRHELVLAGYHSGDIHVDIKDPNSLEKMYQSVGSLDAVVLAVGKTPFKPLEEITAEDYLLGLADKLMGQVNAVLIGKKYLKENGSFTLTSGILNKDPIVMGSAAAMANGALEGFVKSSAIEMPKGLRINIVSPSVITESMEKYAAFFRGSKPVPAAEVALAYSKSVEGAQTGQIYITQ